MTTRPLSPLTMLLSRHTRRRELVTLLAGTVVAPSLLWPLSARAQQSAKTPRIGIIDDSPIWSAFRHGLRDLGYVDRFRVPLRRRDARWRSGGVRARTEPRPARRQYHGEHHPWRGGRWKTRAAAQGDSSLSLARGLPLESG